MKDKILFLLLLAVWGLHPCLQAQEETECNPLSGLPVASGELLFNYGSTSNAFNSTVKSSVVYGQPLVGQALAQDYISDYGVWSLLLMPPQAPIVTATQGDFPDRVLLTWKVDPLGAKPTDGFIILRDDAYLTRIDPGIFQFIDFNVQAGEFYEYKVIGQNNFGDGVPGINVGFVNPNGVVTGKVETNSGNPVVGATVTLSPSIGKSLEFDGFSDNVCVSYKNVLPTDMFTVSTWVKIGDTHDSDGLIDLGSDLDKNFWIHTTPASMGKGIVVGVGNGTAHEITHEFTDSDPNDTVNDPDEWNQVTMVYGGGTMLLYVNGAFITSMKAPISNEPALFSLGSRRDQTGFLDGALDEVRIYNRILTQTEIITTQNITVPSNADGLVAYWKFDEGLGVKVFDLTVNDMDGTLNGTSFSSDAPDVQNAGITDASGFYSIEGINYSEEQSFVATPIKNFYDNYALEFNAAFQGCAVLTNFDLPDTSHVEVTVYPFDLETKQSILSKREGGSDAFNLFIENGNYYLTINGHKEDLGAASTEYQHLAFSINGSTNNVAYYLNGNKVSDLSYPDVTGTWDDETWQLGAKGNTQTTDFFTGLIDEVAFYKDSLLTLQEIQLNAATGGTGGTDNGHGSLFAYFNLNEGSGTELLDIGASLSGVGELKNGDFSIITRSQVATPHEFQPSSKLINVNNSATAIGNVDFTDLSTVAISGFVRFENTFCFQKKVEILNDDESFNPPVFTDSDGKFNVSIEPGKNVKLVAKFGDEDNGETPHDFFPGFWEFRKVNRPVAGVLFQNQTKREVKGQMAGGFCNKSVIPASAMVKVKVETLNGCYSETLSLTNPDGKFTFKNVPPDSVTVSVVEHSNPVIYNYFQLQGGSVLDLREEDDSIGFTYFAPPEVELSDIAVNDCGDAMLNPAQSQTVNVKVFETYTGGKCYLDTALLTINNAIDDSAQFDTLMGGGEFKYKFKAGLPNIVPPYKKVLQVTATAHEEQATETIEAVVLGRRPRETTFASTAPELPTMILRDPPGDGSSASLTKGETTCQTAAFSATFGVSGSQSVEMKLGAELETAVGVGAEVTTKVETENTFGITSTLSFENQISTSMEQCQTIEQTISTGDNDLIVGSSMGGDVYMGGAMNYIFGITDELQWDTMNCNYLVDKGLFVFPDGFATTFIYTENHIENIVIPNLITIGDQESADRWQEVIDLNTELKENAFFAENLSFDAGVVYEKSSSIETTNSYSFEYTVGFSQEFTESFGVTINGNGLTEGITMGYSVGGSVSAAESNTNTRSVSYTLADDDFFDNFSVNVKVDPVYGTPVFDVESGQSSCPHEPNTQPREEVSFSADKLVAVNVPENDAATFTLTLGNIAQSNDIGFYALDLVPNSNPNNAVVTAGGEVMNAVSEYTILPGESLDVDFSIERGPTEYVYEDIKIAYYSACEVEHAQNLGIPRSGVDPKFYKELSFDVHFLEPCSRIDLAQTLEGWVLTPSDGDVLFITVNSYDLTDDDLELVRVQYRRTQGDGAWINIGDDIMKADLGVAGFTIHEWNTNGLQDGNYEIRAITQCFGAQNAGISHIRSGTIERTSPELFGNPEPADGVLSAQDEISITFTEDIRCDLLIQADVFNNNNVGLYDATTNELIDALVSCNNGKITIVPNIQNAFIENRTLRVEIDDIKDMAGNAFVHEDWEFFVDRNPLRWENFDLEDNKYEDETKAVVREITNAGGSIQAYKITGVPAWVEVFPLEGFLVPGETQGIMFKFDETMVLGEFEETITMEGAEGDEPLPVHFRNLCRVPEWEIDANAFTYSMNFTVELNIQGETSIDNMDIVGAFIEDELRGKSYLEYVPALDKYVAFLTVYSNEFIGSDVEFQIWDANDCLLYGDVVESFPYAADEVFGSPNEPIVLHTNGLVLREIPLKTGWNWISFNLGLPDPSLDSSLVSLDNPQEDLIKNQGAFANYYDDPALNGWIGSLTELSNISMFQYRADVPDTISMVGLPIDIGLVDIPLNIGWNWISYVPQSPLPVNEALSSLTPLNGDIIKSQTAFAQYVAGFGWLGNLDFMTAPKGYLLRVAQTGTLTYPENFKGEDEVEKTIDAVVYESPWVVEPGNFEHSMILVGMIEKDGENITQEGQSIGVFVNDEVRGVAQSVYIEQMDEWMFFLTMYANESGEPLTFKLYDAFSDVTTDLDEEMTFAIDGQEGTVQEPTPFKIGDVVNNTNEQIENDGLFVQPNPFSHHLNVRFHASYASEAIISLTDAVGRVIKYEEVNTMTGWNALDWQTANLAPGMYIVKVETGGQTMTSKVMAH